MASWWKPLWSWWTGASHGDNFIRNTSGWQEGARRYGLPVTPDTALRLAAVLCAVRVIGEGVAQAPLKLMRERQEGGKTFRSVASDLKLHTLLHRRPNGWMTSFEWRETMTMHAVLTGNAYSVISRVGGEIDEFIPVRPEQVQTRFEDGEVKYRVTIEGRQIDVPAADMFHLRGPSMDGVAGLEVVQLARDVLGLAQGLQQSQTELQSKGGRPSGVLSTSSPISPEAKDELREEWNRKFGPNGDGGIAVLDNGWSFVSMTMSSVDQQHIENRRFQIEEIGRAFRVLPLMLMQADKATTYASAEQMFIAHVVHTLEPWVQRWEHALDRLIDRDDVYAHFQMQGLMRGAAKDRGDYYSKGLGSPGAKGWLTPNDVRAMEDMDPHPDGDELATGQAAAGEGGGPNADIPFGEDDEDKAYRASQPRGPDGRFLGFGATLARLVGAIGTGGDLKMGLGKVRRAGALNRLLASQGHAVDVRGYRHAASNQAFTHTLKSHGDVAREAARGQIAVTRADFALLPTIVATGTYHPAKQRPFGPRKVEIRAMISGVRYTYEAKILAGKRRVEMVTMWKK